VFRHVDVFIAHRTHPSPQKARVEHRIGSLRATERRWCCWTKTEEQQQQAFRRW
jgi:hypothetical protein